MKSDNRVQEEWRAKEVQQGDSLLLLIRANCLRTRLQPARAHQNIDLKRPVDSAWAQYQVRQMLWRDKIR